MINFYVFVNHDKFHLKKSDQPFVQKKKSDQP